MKKTNPIPEDPIPTIKEREEHGDPRAPGTGERHYPTFESASEKDASLVDRAEKWAKAYADKDPKGMDKQLAKLEIPEINRVIVMGQKILAGLPPIKKEKEKKDAKD